MQGTLLFLISLYYIFPMSSTEVIPRVANILQSIGNFYSEASIFVEYNRYQYEK